MASTKKHDEIAQAYWDKVETHFRSRGDEECINIFRNVLVKHRYNHMSLEGLYVYMYALFWTTDSMVLLPGLYDFFPPKWASAEWLIAMQNEIIACRDDEDKFQKLCRRVGLNIPPVSKVTIAKRKIPARPTWKLPRVAKPQISHESPAWKPYKVIKARDVSHNTCFQRTWKKKMLTFAPRPPNFPLSEMRESDTVVNGIGCSDSLSPVRSCRDGSPPPPDDGFEWDSNAKRAEWIYLTSLVNNARDQMGKAVHSS